MRVGVHQFDGVTTFQALPLAAGLLVASARRAVPDAAFEVRTARGDPDAAAADADVLAFSTYVWNQRYSLEVARRAKARRPDALVVFGGPSVPRRPDRVAAFLREHEFVDALVFGEGELAFAEILTGRPLPGIPGLGLRSGLTAPRERIGDLAQTGSPYLDGTFDALLDAGAAPGAAILETNRGCPFECTFCDWGQAIASRVNELPRERIFAELAWIAERRIPYLYIVDANYGIRKRDLEIIREIGRCKARTGFPQYVFFHLTKNATERHLEVVTALREAGIGTHLALSAQDFEPRVLVAVKRENISLDRALALRRTCHERGIPTFNELILGLPEQTYDSFARSLARAVTPWPLDAFQLYLARMIENAEMSTPEHRARYGIETRHVSISSFQHERDAGPVPELEEIVVATRAMPVDDWRRAFRFGFFLAAAHNLRLLDVALQAARPRLVELVERLLERLGEIRAVLDRYADAILDGQAMVLPAAATGAHLWAVEDAVLLEALSDRERFYAQVAQAAPGLAEVVRYQAFVTPGIGDCAPRRATFAHDFAAFREQALEAPPLSEVTLRWRAS
ncbi:MAG: B12-binding domain-containing radical SAM protein, partial [Myxococcales bacterium]